MIEVECMFRERLYGIKLFPLGVNLIEGSTKQNAIISDLCRHMRFGFGPLKKRAPL